MATAGPWSALHLSQLDRVLIDGLERLGYSTMTPVQAAAIPPLLTSRDVAVDAETGSGKTLSFLVPIAQMLICCKSTRCLHPVSSVRALIIVPTRELAAQVHATAQSLFKVLPGNIVPVPLIGGLTATGVPGPDPQYASDTRVVIATPGRLNAAITEGVLVCRDLDILIMDEADRLLDMGFAVALTSILTRLPKQRRTGLYSATQTSEVDALARAGLRNPVRVAVRVKHLPFPENEGSRVKDTDDLEFVQQDVSNRQIIPKSLKCYYTVIKHEHKLHHFLQLLYTFPQQKIIVYFLTCACVDFFARLPLEMLLTEAYHMDPRNVGKRNEPNTTTQSKRKFITLHGKMTQSKRTRALSEFAGSKNGILACTDVAARGLDIPDVDWVIQFDPPQDPDAYVHRVGRTARLGKEGRSLIYLAPSEDAYAEFLAVRNCPATKFDWEQFSAFSNYDKPCEAASSSQSQTSPVKTELSEIIQCPNEAQCSRVTALTRKSILADRAILDAAEKGFLTYLRAYKEHRCSYLLPFASLEVGSVARYFSLFRLPRFQEFKKFKTQIDFAPDKNISVRDIAYKDRHREKLRQADIQCALNNRQERRDALRAKSKKLKKRKPKSSRERQVGPNPTATKGTILLNEVFDDAALDEINEEARMIKKLKRGVITQEEFDKEAGYAAVCGSNA